MACVGLEIKRHSAVVFWNHDPTDRLLEPLRDGTLSTDVAPPAIALLARLDRRDGAASFF